MLQRTPLSFWLQLTWSPTRDLLMMLSTMQKKWEGKDINADVVERIPFKIMFSIPYCIYVFNIAHSVLKVNGRTGHQCHGQNLCQFWMRNSKDNSWTCFNRSWRKVWPIWLNRWFDQLQDTVYLGFFMCHKICKKTGKCVTFQLLSFILPDFKSVLLQTIPDYNFCVLNILYVWKHPQVV